MHKLILSLLILTITLSAAKSKGNALISDKPKTNIILAQNGQSKAVIIIATAASSAEKKSAEELKKYIDQISGAKFQIQTDQNTPDGAYISVGNTALAKKTGFDKLTLGREGVAVKVLNGNVYLLGGREGIMNAVMAFLEEDLGCRWYSDKWIFIPKNKNLKAGVTDRISIPDFSRRFVFSAHSMTNNPAWTRHNRVMKWNLFNHIDGWFCHTYKNICPKTDFYKHPDFFAKDKKGKPSNAQLCPTHPEVVKRAKELAMSALKANKRKDAFLISISEFDGRKADYCHCKRCEALVKKHKSLITPNMSLVNEVARYIKKDFPDVKVDFIVYAPENRFRRTPINFKLESNVVMWYCTNNLAHYETFKKKNKLVAEFSRWRKLINTINIWEYGCNYTKYFDVEPSLHAKTENLKFWKTQGVNGIMFQEVFGTRGGDQQALRAWILSKMLWNSKLDPDKLALDFCKGVFGNAGPEMFEYYHLVKKAGVAEKSIDEYYGKSVFVDKANKIFAKAFAKADKSGNTDLRERIEIHYVPIAFMEIDALFRGYPANRKNFPTKRYRWLLEQFKKITKREKMNMLDETRGMQGYILELELLLNATKGGVLSISSIYGTNYAYRTRKDPLATNGLASFLPCDGRWLVQWHFPANLCIPRRKYQIRAQLRLMNDSSSNIVAHAGVCLKVNKQRSKAVCSKKFFVVNISGKKLSSKKYTWVNIGKPFVPEKDSYTFLAGKRGGKFGGLFVDKIELVPVK